MTKSFGLQIEDTPSKANNLLGKETKEELNEKIKRRRLFPKESICQLLAESVHSYSYSCKIIAEYTFQGGTSSYVPEVGL
jgi:hypothetical protein